MSESTPSDVERKGWLADLMGGASKALAFGRASGRKAVVSPVPPPRRTAGTDLRGKSAEIHRLASEGVPHSEIARRTALAQDTVALLLQLPSREPAESAGGGTFFRILQARIAG